MRTITQRVVDALEQGPATATKLAVTTGLTKKQVEGVAFRLKADGKLQRGPGGSSDGEWSIVGHTPTRVAVSTNGTNGLGLGDLFEVAGTLADGTWTIRSLDAPHTIYALKEVQ